MTSACCEWPGRSRLPSSPRGRGRVRPPARRASRRLAADRRRAADGGLYERGDRATTRLSLRTVARKVELIRGAWLQEGDEVMSPTQTRPDRTGPPLDVLDQIDRGWRSVRGGLGGGGHRESRTISAGSPMRTVPTSSAPSWQPTSKPAAAGRAAGAGALQRGFPWPLGPDRFGLRHGAVPAPTTPPGG